MKTDHLPQILIVEDDDTDILHFQRLMSKTGLEDAAIYVSNGDKALDVLRAQTPAYGVCPALIITDLNIPGINGHELIEDIRATPAIENSVIFVLSTSDLEADMQRAYRNKVAGYFIKDEAGASLKAAVEMVKHYRLAVGAGLSLN